MVNQVTNAVSGMNPLNITIHSNDYKRRENLSGYIHASFNEEHGFNVGTGELTVAADHRLARRLMQAHMDVVPVTCEWNGWRWTGHVKSYVASGKPGNETVTAELVNDLSHLLNVLAYANPNAGLWVQGKHDRRKGRLLTVAYEYLSENLKRLDLPVYLMLPPNDDTSPIIDLAARMTNMRDLLGGVLNQYDYDIKATMWWPGQPIPRGVAAPLIAKTEEERQRALQEAALYKAFGGEHEGLWDEPGLVIEILPPRRRQFVRFTTQSGEITQMRLTGTAPGPARIVTGGKADDWVNEAKNLGIDIVVQAGTTALNAAATAAIGASIGSIAGPAGSVVGTAVGAFIGFLGNLISDWVKAETDDAFLAFVERTDVARAAYMGPFHPREQFVPSTAGAFTFDTQALAERALQENKGGQAVEIEMGHSVSKNLGFDEIVTDDDTLKLRYGYLVGDLVTFEEHLSGVVVQDILSGVTIADDVGERVRIAPRVGKRKNVSNPYQEFVDKLNGVDSTTRDMSVL
ncbi:hypothetical protein H0194_04530 [Corynebacterium incognita]|uniref:Gp28/Gp37-like domain-containing protein n=1 Tax=Corynebacterium incognita TaxID=2754725 RepID=A0A7G7CRN5_9CORY|nr:hypothetical protein [Corynebacterium incognita]QNE90251.1 hypothetical protein H0194_04530 [Corynebacterium incognita]